MIRFLLSRFLQGIVVILAVFVITFVLQKLSPTSPFNGERNVPEEVRKTLESYYGYDKPWLVQMWLHIKAFATFNPPDCVKSPAAALAR